jgi:hypothetical protein
MRKLSLASGLMAVTWARLVKSGTQYIILSLYTVEELLQYRRRYEMTVLKHLL